MTVPVIEIREFCNKYCRTHMLPKHSYGNNLWWLLSFQYWYRCFDLCWG